MNTLESSLSVSNLDFESDEVEKLLFFWLGRLMPTIVSCFWTTVFK